jgi:hypothetical protein
MYIRHTDEADIPQIMKIYESARSFMAKEGNPDQWGADNWPPESLIRSDIVKNKSYVCISEKDDRVIGTFYFDFGPEPEPDYRTITDGSWLSALPYGVVHRLASDRSERGIGSFCIQWAINRSGGHLRIDTHDANRPMRSLLSKLGFSERGGVMIGGNKPRIAYEITVAPFTFS